MTRRLPPMFGAIAAPAPPPPDWRLFPLGLLFRERKETVSASQYPPLSVTKRGVIPQLETAAKSDAVDSRKLVLAGDFVINSRSDRNGSSGVSDRDGSVSNIYSVLVPRGDIERRFAHHLLRSVPFQQEYFRWGNGIVDDLWTTRYAAMRRIELAIPPLARQTSIADFLDRETARIDTLIEKQEKLIETLRERRQAVISNVTTAGENPLSPDGLEMKFISVGFEYNVVLGKMLDAGNIPREGETVLPYIRAANIQDGGLSLDDVNSMRFSAREASDLDLRRDDLLVVEGGAVGTNVVLEEDMPGWSFQKTVNRVRARGQWSTRYLSYVLLAYRDSGVIDVICNRSTIPHFTAEKLAATPIPIRDPEKQRAIVAQLDAETARIDKLINKAERFIELAKERRSALITAAVTGQIEVGEMAVA